MAFTKLSFGQQLKKSIDYEYFRDEKSYYAFELFKDSSSRDDLMLLNFTSNVAFKKVDKIYIQKGAKEIKLKFKTREDIVSSDNPELKFYPIVFNARDLNIKEIGCEAKIIFKTDNGFTYTLPLILCPVIEETAKN